MQILCFRTGNGFLNAQMFQDTIGCPLHVTLPDQCNDRDIHAERLVTGGGSCVRETIQGNIRQSISRTMQFLIVGAIDEKNPFPGVLG